MKAAFMTEGKTMTHSALSRRSAGISSGILRISVITWPAFSMRLFSSFWADAGRPAKAITAINKKILFIDVLLLARSSVQKPPCALISWLPTVQFSVLHAVIVRDIRHKHKCPVQNHEGPVVLIAVVVRPWIRQTYRVTPSLADG